MNLYMILPTQTASNIQLLEHPTSAATARQTKSCGQVSLDLEKGEKQELMIIIRNFPKATL